MIHREGLLSLTAKFHALFKTLRETLDDRVIRRGLWPLYSTDLTPCKSHFWGSLRAEVYKTNPRTLEELKKNIHQESLTISGKKTPENK